MANWDFVVPLDMEIANWLHDEGYPLLPVKAGNRLPTTGEMKAALEAQGNLVLDYPRVTNSFHVFEKGETGYTICIKGFDWDDNVAVPDVMFSIHGMCDLQATILTALSERCGQLVMIPDTGAPVVVFPTILDPHSLTELLWEAHEHCKENNDWEFVAKILYPGPTPQA